jgi:hypothetical protein
MGPRPGASSHRPPTARRRPWGQGMRPASKTGMAETGRQETRDPFLPPRKLRLGCHTAPRWPRCDLGPSHPTPDGRVPQETPMDRGRCIFFAPMSKGPLTSVDSALYSKDTPSPGCGEGHRPEAPDRLAALETMALEKACTDDFPRRTEEAEETATLPPRPAGPATSRGRPASAEGCPLQGHPATCRDGMPGRDSRRQARPCGAALGRVLTGGPKFRMVASAITGADAPHRKATASAVSRLDLRAVRRPVTSQVVGGGPEIPTAAGSRLRPGSMPALPVFRAAAGEGTV